MRREDHPSSSVQLLSIPQSFCFHHCITTAFFLSGKTWLLYICFHINPCHLSDCKYIPLLTFPPTCLLNFCGVCMSSRYFRFLLPAAYRSWWNMCMHNLLLLYFCSLFFTTVTHSGYCWSRLQGQSSIFSCPTTFLFLVFLCTWRPLPLLAWVVGAWLRCSVSLAGTERLSSFSLSLHPAVWRGINHCRAAAFTRPAPFY